MAACVPAAPPEHAPPESPEGEAQAPPSVQPESARPAEASLAPNGGAGSHAEWPFRITVCIMIRSMPSKSLATSSARVSLTSTTFCADWVANLLILVGALSAHPPREAGAPEAKLPFLAEGVSRQMPIEVHAAFAHRSLGQPPAQPRSDCIGLPSVLQFVLRCRSPLGTGASRGAGIEARERLQLRPKRSELLGRHHVALGLPNGSHGKRRNRA